MRSWSWPKRSANSKPWDGRGSSCKSCCISYYGTLLQRPCFSRKHQHLSGDCGQPFLCGVPRHGCHPLCLGMVSLRGGQQQAPPIDLLHMTYAQQSMIGSGGYMPEDVQEIMSCGKWDLERIITHEFPLVE